MIHTTDCCQNLVLDIHLTSGETFSVYFPSLFGHHIKVSYSEWVVENKGAKV